MTTQPYHNIFNITFCIFPFFSGAKSVVLETFELPRFLEAIQNFKVTYAHIAVSHLADLAESALENYDLNSLNTILLTEHADEVLINRVQSRLKNVKVKQAYGVNNFTPALMMTPSNKIKPGSAGVLLAETEAKILDSVTKEELDVNIEGDLYVKGLNTPTEYYNNPDASKEGFDENKFMRTGDRAKVDTDGYWWILPKAKPEEPETGSGTPPQQSK